MRPFNYILIALTLLVFWPASTFAFFNDGEVSNTEVLSTGTLSFTAAATSTSGTSPKTFNFSVDNTGSHNPQYSFWVATSTCTGVSFSLSSLANPFEGNHSVGVSGNPAAACQFSVLISAWQQGFSYGGGGFTASQALTFNLTVIANPPQPTATVVLNEIYPNRNAASSTPLNTEWIELYNGTGSAVNVNNWLIRVDNSNNNIEPSCSGAANKMAPMNGASTTIPAGGLLVVEFCNNGGFNKLPNGGATVRLSPSGVGNTIDTHAYPNTAVGKSHARIPDGGSWVDPIPSPGESNLTTVTRDDLEAEGWTEEKIDAILGEEPTAPVEMVEEPIVESEPVVDTASTTPEIIEEEVILPEEEVIVKEEEKTTDEVEPEVEKVVTEEPPVVETPIEPVTSPEPVEEVTTETYE